MNYNAARSKYDETVLLLELQDDSFFGRRFTHRSTQNCLSASLPNRSSERPTTRLHPLIAADYRLHASKKNAFGQTV